MGLEQRIDNLVNSINANTIATQELVDILIGVVETKGADILTSAVVAARERRINHKIKEFSQLDARALFYEFHKLVGEEISLKFLRKFGVETVVNIDKTEINKFCRRIKNELKLLRYEE